jgi:hypothetical protein
MDNDLESLLMMSTLNYKFKKNKNMNNTKERLLDIEKNGYQIDFGDVFNKTFENYKKIALYAGLVLFVIFVLLSIFAGVSLIILLGEKYITQELQPEKLTIKLQNPDFLIPFAGISILITVLLAPFKAAFLKMADCGEKNEEFKFAQMFTYYSLPYLKEIVIATSIITIVSTGLSVLFAVLKINFIGNIIQYAFSFITFLSIPLLIFGKLSALEAIQYSIKLVLKQPAVLLGLLIVSIIGVLVGLMGCCVGVFFTYPFLFSMTYSIYSTIMGIDTLQDDIS